jgi:hypothetical protein
VCRWKGRRCFHFWFRVVSVILPSRGQPLGAFLYPSLVEKLPLAKIVGGVYFPDCFGDGKEVSHGFWGSKWKRLCGPAS